MSPNQALVSELVELSVPILCVDTCTLLDVIRDVTRETIQPVDALAGLALLSAAENGPRLAVLIAEQVSVELSANVSDVQQESEDRLRKFVEQVERVDKMVGMFGGAGAVSTAHLAGHAGRARTALDRWKAVARTIVSDLGVTARAFARVNAPRSPARKGKESMKDCVVVETYLGLAAQLRSAGLSVPIVFASSNTKEYFAPNTSHLSADIASDFSVLSVEYAATYGMAKHLLAV